jgi:prolipoprotein diacylglyceryltransferase
VLSLPPAVRIFVAREPTDLRKSFDTLAALVPTVLAQDAFSGHLFCCYGIPWNGPLAVVFPPESFAYRDQVARGLLPPGVPHSLPVVPVQLVSAGLAFLAFAGLLWFFQRPHRDGAVFYAFLIFYGTLRLAMVPLRQEALRSMVAFSLGFIAVGTLGLLLARRVVTAPAKPTRRLSPVR